MTCFDDASRAGALLSMMQKVAVGDRQAFSELFVCAHAPVYAMAMRILRSSECAEEVVCDVFLYVWKNPAAYDQRRGTVMAWLNVATRSRALDQLRLRKKRAEQAAAHDGINSLLSTSRPEDVLAQFQIGTAVHSALATLSPLRRQLMDLAFFRGLSHAEAAKFVGLSVGTVKSHIRRALRLMRAFLVATHDGNAAKYFVDTQTAFSPVRLGTSEQLGFGSAVAQISVVDV